MGSKKYINKKFMFTINSPFFSRQMKKKYQQKRLLTFKQVINDLKSIQCPITILNRDEEYHINGLPKKDCQLIVFITQNGVLGLHFGVAVKYKSQYIIFDGASHHYWPRQWRKRMRSKCVKYQRDYFSCGFRTIHWVHVLCGYGVQKWINDFQRDEK